MRAPAVALLLALAAPPAAAEPRWSELRPVYEDLHAHPELSFHEAATAARLAERLRALGFTVTTGVGGTGVVGVLRNGPGKVVMLRTELDALPVEEKTGLPYASQTSGVMHACGHDVHMTAWLGAAATLASDRKSWSGTLLMVGQPAEELVSGAKAMLDDGLFARFPRPDAALAIHDSPDYPAGTVALLAGPVLASSDSVDLVVHGRGGHAARPQVTVDPIVVAAKIVVGLQTLVSRENDPFDPAVVTVGSFHGGTKHNIIPDDAKLQLSVRAYKPAVRERLLAGIERIARAEAQAARAEPAPEMTIVSSTPVTVNDAALVARARAALRARLGDAHVVDGTPVTGAEDFSRYAEAGVPILMVFVGAADPDALARARREGAPLPGLHSSLFHPEAEATITTGVATLVAVARDAFRRR